MPSSLFNTSLSNFFNGQAHSRVVSFCANVNIGNGSYALDLNKGLKSGLLWINSALGQVTHEGKWKIFVLSGFGEHRTHA